MMDFKIAAKQIKNQMGVPDRKQRLECCHACSGVPQGATGLGSLGGPSFIVQ